MRSFLPKWAGALLLALLFVLPAAGCGGSGGGGGGGDDPCAVVWTFNTPLTARGWVYCVDPGIPDPFGDLAVMATVTVGGKTAMVSQIRVIDPDGLQREFKSYVDPQVSDPGLFMALMPSMILLPDEQVKKVDKLGCWTLQLSLWSSTCGDSKASVTFCVEECDTPPPPPPNGECSLDVNWTPGGCPGDALGWLWHINLLEAGVLTTPAWGQVHSAWLRFVSPGGQVIERYIDPNPFDLVDLCRCFGPAGYSSGYWTVQAFAEAECPDGGSVELLQSAVKTVFVP